MLHISFRKAMNGPEQNCFWDSLGNCLKTIYAYGGGSQDVFTLKWGIDYSQAHLDEYAVKKHIASFLEKQRELVSDFSFYKR